MRVPFALVALIALFLALPARADEKANAVAAMEAWLSSIDAGKYAESWQSAAANFQKAVTEAEWVSTLNSVRTPLGACTSRKLASAFQQKEVPTPEGPVQGNFVIAQFETSFANLKYAIETVTFAQEGGAWKASGYYIKPK